MSSYTVSPNTLIFSTHNEHKLEEVKKIMDPGYELLSLTAIGIADEIEENGVSFEENALIKSRFIFERTGINCFSDDSGLVVDALDGEPGIYSARYSGSRDMQQNMNLLLENMKGKEIRTARFICVISLIRNGINHFFTGVTEGIIRKQASGAGGFGYDPVFQPYGYQITFAEMPAELKNEMSHRAQAVKLLNAHLAAHPQE